MRGQIIDAIYRRMERDPDVFFLTGDMGINLVEKIQSRFPDRYVNVGIAEQDLIGVSAGLANLGFRPFAYTISNFLVHRCFEQVRNDVALHEYPVTLIGTSVGYDNAPLGPTHHIIDDWGALKSIPGIDIYCPSSVPYAEGLVDYLIEEARPAYVRIPKGEFPAPAARTADEHAILVPGRRRDDLLISYGAVAQHCLTLQREKPEISVLVVNRLRPLDEDRLVDALRGHQRVHVIEDHFAATGLYSDICQLTVRCQIPCAIHSIAPGGYSLQVGSSASFYHQKYDLTPAGIARALDAPPTSPPGRPTVTPRERERVHATR